MEIAPIGHIESPYPTKFGVPRQPGLVRSLVSWLVLDGRGLGASGGAGAAALAGLEAGERLWLVWAFSRNLDASRSWSPTVRPPRLGGNQRLGVFATRSSFRPNGLAISSVQVARVEHAASAPARIAFTGGDMVDGTPVYAVRRYDPARDSVPEATSGWVERHDWPQLADVEIPAAELARIPQDLRAGLRELLLQDPRPAYTRGTQPDREFWVPLARLVVWFRVDTSVVHVTRVRALDDAAYRQLKQEGTIS